MTTHSMKIKTDKKPAAMTSRSFTKYRSFIAGHYDGVAGALTGFTGLITGHEALAGRLIRPGRFDVRGCKRILDAGCGNGRYTKYLLRHAAPEAVLTTFDLSPAMLKRARNRLGSDRVSHAVADLTCLPYADGCFDAVVCGYVLEHLPDPSVGLSELARVLVPGGRLLLLCTENTFMGKMTGRMWHCQTYRRDDLRSISERCGLRWGRELWFTDLHRLMRMGGIVVELHREGTPNG